MKRISSYVPALMRSSPRSVDVVFLDDAPPLLRFEIARDGQVLFERTTGCWAFERARAMIDWWDWVPWLGAWGERRSHGFARRLPDMVNADVVSRKVSLARRRLSDAETLFARAGTRRWIRLVYEQRLPPA